MPRGRCIAFEAARKARGISSSMKYGRYDRRRFRDAGEGVALRFLEEQGHLLLRHNYRLRGGEIDLITADPADDFRLHAVEVKAWATNPADPYIHPLHALNARKQARMRRVIESFRQQAARRGVVRVSASPAGRADSGKDSVDAEPAWILAQAGCVHALDQLDVSFDLVWVQANDHCEWFRDLF